MSKFNCDAIENFKSPHTGKPLCCGAAKCKYNNNKDLTACDEGEYQGFNMFLVTCHKTSDIKDCEYRNDEKATNICQQDKDDQAYCLTMDLEANKANAIFFSTDKQPPPGVSEKDRAMARQARAWTFIRIGQNESLDNAASCCSPTGCNLCDQSSSPNVYCGDMFDENSKCTFMLPGGREAHRSYYNKVCPIHVKSSLAPVGGPGGLAGIIIGVLSLIATAIGTWYAYRAVKKRKVSRKESTENKDSSKP